MFEKLVHAGNTDKVIVVSGNSEKVFKAFVYAIQEGMSDGVTTELEALLIAEGLMSKEDELKDVDITLKVDESKVVKISDVLWLIPNDSDNEGETDYVVFII